MHYPLFRAMQLVAGARGDRPLRNVCCFLDTQLRTDKELQLTRLRRCQVLKDVLRFIETKWFADQDCLVSVDSVDEVRVPKPRAPTQPLTPMFNWLPCVGGSRVAALRCNLQVLSWHSVVRNEPPTSGRAPADDVEQKLNSSL
ncbi:hypothetical protein VTK26DRAFT_6109 [Humicola hyalothermophila]